MKEQVTKSGEKHGLVNRVGNSVKDTKFKNMSTDTKNKAEALRKDDARLVKVRYINYRGANERLEMPYCRWEGDTIDMYKFIPDQEYEIPYGLVKQVNSNPGLPVRSEICDASGIPTMKDGKPFKIHEFIPIGF